MAREIGRRLGIDPQRIEPVSLKQQVFKGLKGARVIKEDGKTWEPLLTITAGDIAEMGVQGEPQIGRIPLKEFREKGIYQVPRRSGETQSVIGSRPPVVNSRYIQRPSPTLSG